MSNISEYKIIAFNTNVDTHAPAVNEAIEDGWQPYGSPMKTGTNVHQAMVKYEPGSVTQPIQHEAPADRPKPAKTPAKKKATPKAKAKPAAKPDEWPAADTPSPYGNVNPQ